MATRWFIFFVFIVLPALVFAEASDTLVISQAIQFRHAAGSAIYLLDPDSRFTVEEVHRRFAHGEFFSLGERTPNFTGQRGKIWFRLVIANQTQDPLFLYVNNLYVERIQIFTQDSLHRWSVKSTGFSYPFNSRDIPASRYGVGLNNCRPNTTSIVYGSIEAEARPPMFLPIDVGSFNEIVNRTRTSEFLSLAVLGILLVMLLYNICLFIIIDDSLYLHYCFYIFSAIVCVLFFTGYSFEWFWPNHPSLNPYPWQMGLFTFAQMLFVNKLLRLVTELRRFLVITLLIYLLSLLIMFGTFLPKPLVLFVVMFNGTLMPIYFLGASVHLALKRKRMAYVFLIGWSPILIATLMNILMVTDVIAYSVIFDTHAIEISLAWEVVVFSLALGYRYNLMRQEKMEMQSENMRIISEQKTLLRKMVFEQTEEIMSQNDQLIRNQEEIKLQNERLETQNKAYERLKEMILKQNQELESAVQKRTLQLAQSNEELKKHLHQVEQFSFIAAHNLRAPVARIMGLVAILEQSSVTSKDDGMILEKLLAAAQDLDAIIHDLGSILDIQKNQSDKTEMIDVRGLIDKILDRFEPEVGRDGIQVSIDAKASYIVAIPAYIDSILSNLISNSIKYRSDQRASVIQITTEESNSYWKIVVDDNGLGFDSKLFSRKLFEPFQRFHTHKDGKGLGMFLVKTQVDAMNGTIELSSQPNKGTHVEVNIPKTHLQKIA